MATTQQSTTKNATPDNSKEVKRDPIFTRNLRCELTQEELNTLARDAARLVNEIDQKDEDQKAASKQAKAQIAELIATHRRISEEIRVGATHKPVRIERRYYYRTGQVVEVRLDTEKVINERAMTDRERQLDFDALKQTNGNGKGEIVDELEELNGAEEERAAANANGNGSEDDDYGQVEETDPEPEEEAPLATQKPKRRGRPRKGAKPS